MDFKYALGPHFDRQKVKGRVALLLKLAQENYPSAQALEVASSGKLQSVVVDDEKVAKDLLNSRLERKVHLIPLSKIEPRTITTSVSAIYYNPSIIVEFFCPRNCVLLSR